MFGYPALFMNGNLFFSLFEDSAILRMPEADRSEFGDRFRLEIFEPMAGRPMREYVVIPSQLFASDEVEQWVERAAAYARTLPPKQPRAKRPTR
nr:TfoX/Sxy family protein [Galbitalea soli]